MAPPARIALVGTGNIARVHMAALRDLPGAEVVAAVDTDPGRLAGFGAGQGINQLFASLAGMLTAVRPDLVHLCTPPALHYRQAALCLRSGVSVLAEKPPVLSLRELDGLAGDGLAGAGPAAGAEGAERGAGPWFATVFQHRFGSGARTLRAVMASGALGRPLLAICHTTWFRDQAYFEVPWRGRWASEGGGPTLGHGIHQIDLLAHVLGDWSEVSAVARRLARRTETEDVSLAQVSFASGAVASVVSSVLSPREESYLRFDFEHGTVELTHLYGYADRDWRVTPAPGCEERVLAAWAAGERGTPSGHRAQFAEVLRCASAGQPPPVTLPDARRTLALVTAVYAAAFSGHPVRPADLVPGSPFYSTMEGTGAPWRSA